MPSPARPEAIGQAGLMWPHRRAKWAAYTARTMKALTLLVVGLLVSCAPTMNAPTVGRIVNSATGEEGRISFAPGALRPRLGEPFAPDNATIQIGGQTYTGRTAILEGAASSPLPAGWGLSVTFAGGGAVGQNGAVGFGTTISTPSQGGSAPPVVRTGNLIARTAAAASEPVRTLTCTLTVDERGHGIGECTGQDNVKYALQF